MTNSWLKTSCVMLACALATPVWADRVKDLATVAAQRSNQLIGFGLVVGLQAPATMHPCHSPRKA